MTTRIFIIAHAPLAHALRECALHVFADSADSVLALDVLPQASPDDTLAQARLLLRALLPLPVLDVSTVLALVAYQQQRKTAASLVAGVNLPMLLRAVCYRAEPLDALVQRAVVGGSQGVMQVPVSALPEQIFPCPHP